MTKQVSQEAEAPFSQANGEEKSVYEAGFHVVPTVAEDKVGGVVERIRAEIEKAGGSIISEGSPKKIQFTYVIERARAGKREKYAEGYFGWVKFEASSAAVKHLETFLALDNDVLRSLIIHVSREEIVAPVARSVFSSNALAGEVLQKKPVAPEVQKVAASNEEIDKTIDSLVS